MKMIKNTILLLGAIMALNVNTNAQTPTVPADLNWLSTNQVIGAYYYWKMLNPVVQTVEPTNVVVDGITNTVLATNYTPQGFGEFATNAVRAIVRNTFESWYNQMVQKKMELAVQKGVVTSIASLTEEEIIQAAEIIKKWKTIDPALRSNVVDATKSEPVPVPVIDTNAVPLELKTKPRQSR